MALKRPTLRSAQSYTQWIEESGYKAIRCRQIPLDDYVFGHDLCEKFHLDIADLMTFLTYSKHVHGLVLPSGAIFIHPDGFTRFLQLWSARAMSSLKYTHPFTGMGS